MEQDLHHESEASSIFSDLPSHIAVEILSRLSTKSVSRCRCVCKQWQALLLSPEFVSSLQSRTRPALMLHAVKTHPSILTTFDLEDEPISFPVTNLTEELTPGSTSMLGSVNGLLCFHEFGWNNPDRILVLNPVTMESVTLPGTGGLMEFPHVTSYGFGETSYEIKAVKIYQEKRVEEGERYVTSSECHVYTLGKGSWRLLPEPAPFLYSCRSHGVFFNGYIHWLVEDRTEKISRFDLEEESFAAFPAPPGFGQRGLANLGVYEGGFLSICDNSSEFETAIWVMEEYGVEESWAKKIVIDKRRWGKDGLRYEVVRLLRVFEDGVILLLWGDYHLYSYNPETRCLRKIQHQNLAGLPERYTETIEVVDYVPSFVSLKRFGRETVQN